jgi:hypothetical protein
MFWPQFVISIFFELLVFFFFFFFFGVLSFFLFFLDFCFFVAVFRGFKVICFCSLFECLVASSCWNP